MNSITELSPQQLRKAADLRERIDALKEQLDELIGAPAEVAVTEAPEKAKKRKVSAAARARMRQAQKERWARIKGEKEVAAPEQKPKRKMSPAAKKRLSELAKARWATAKKAGKTRL
jgi:hypothetical protein